MFDLPLAGKVVEWHQLFQVVYSALGAAVAVTIAFSVAVAGATRFVEARRDDRPGQAGVWAAVAALGLAVCGGAIALGIIVMTAKT